MNATNPAVVRLSCMTGNLARALALTATLLRAGVAIARAGPSDAERLQKALSGLTPGKPTGCISQVPTMNSATYDGAVLYQQGRTKYLQRFGGQCNIRSDFDILITRSYSSQLCRGDIATIVQQGSAIPRGSCVFGDFEPYTAVKK